MRKLTSHQVNECNAAIEIQPSGEEKNAGGIPFRYDVFGPRKEVAGVGLTPSFGLNIRFQNGPVIDGINGVTNEVFLAILEDRLVTAQAGAFACNENIEALYHVRAAQVCLKSRTDARAARGVEGTHQV